MKSRMWTGVTLVLVCLLVMVLPARADGVPTYTYYGFTQVGARVQYGDPEYAGEPTPGQMNATMYPAYLSVCGAKVDATIVDDEITVTWTPLPFPVQEGVPCGDPIFNDIGPLTFTGHRAQGSIGKIRGVEFPLVAQPGGGTGAMVERFEAMTGCTVTGGDFPELRGYWTDGVQGGLVVTWEAQCGDVLFGVPVPVTTLHWGWGFLGFAPQE